MDNKRKININPHFFGGGSGGGITPTGQKVINITENGEYTDNITQYATVKITTDVQPSLTDVEVTPTTAEQSVSTPEGYDGISNVTVAAVTAEIDANITAENIKQGVEILGVEGTLEGDDFLEKFASKTLTNISCTTPLDNLIKFKNQTYLTTADFVFREPTVDSCYNFMFQGCTSLTTAPALPATTLKHSCYYYMFKDCTSLTTAPSLPATTLADYCYQGMFDGCTSLTTAPALPATTLKNQCYYYMFSGCTSLQKTGEIAAKGSISSYVSNMFSGCTSLRETTWTATTPPTINSNTFSNCPDDMVIYVPDASVDAYKAASIWSSRAAYIKCISEKPS